MDERIDDAVIFHMASQIVFVFFHDGKGDTAVINQYGTADGDVMDKVGIGHINDIIMGGLSGSALNSYGIPAFDAKRVFTGAGSDFRALGVQEDTDFVRDFSCVPNHLQGILVGHMGCVQPYNGHSRFIKPPDKFGGAV